MQSPTLKREVRYLGVTFYGKLTFKNHIKNITERWLRALWACKRTVGNTWGLKPSMMHLLYTRLVSPVVSYSSVAWWYKANALMHQGKWAR